MTNSPQTDAVKQRQRARANKMADAASGGWVVVLVKIVALGLVDAIAIFAALTLFGAGDYLVGSIVVIVAAIVNLIYFSKRMLPAKYLAPGIIFLLIFQI